jgi:hypothetical protein
MTCLSRGLIRGTPSTLASINRIEALACAGTVSIPEASSHFRGRETMTAKPRGGVPESFALARVLSRWYPATLLGRDR